MPTVERLETWRGQDVLDEAGTKAGHLEDVYYDSTASEPVLISIKHGMLGHQFTLVPVADAVVCRDYVQVPFSAEQINRSQTTSLDDELATEQIAAIGALYELTLPLGGPAYSAQLIERRRAEAEKAEAEAEQREQELEEARKRAGAAAEEARAAERAREKADAATLDARPN